MKNNSDMITKTEKQLIHLTKMNSDDGFAELARRYQPLMYKLASEFIDGGRLSPDELPDLMQEMLMTLHRVANTFDQKQGEVSPYYAEKDDPLFTRLQAILDGDLVLDDLKTDIVEVKLWGEATAGAYPAIKEECYIEVSSYGGDTTGYQIPFNVHYTGVKTKGTFDPATKKFTQA